jgi:hypothetical protein
MRADRTKSWCRIVNTPPMSNTTASMVLGSIGVVREGSDEVTRSPYVPREHSSATPHVDALAL